jgi:hypothetical protein
MRVHGCNASATGIAGRPERPPAFTLFAPYPNPTAGPMSLDYHIDEEGPVTVALYDVAGRLVSVLMENEFQPAGPGTIHFDTRGMAAGVYFVRMELDSRSVSRRITIVR